MNRMTEYTNKEKGFALPASLPDNDLGDTYSLEDICCKLAPFEDAEEQGLIVILQCKVGDKVYGVSGSRGFVSTYEIISIEICKYYIYYYWKLLNGIYDNIDGFPDHQIGSTVFLSREDAEATFKANL